MKFSILFWNVWFYNQTEGTVRYKQLLSELRRLLDQHTPDLVALNEVARPSGDQRTPLIMYLQQLGYTHNHCAKMTPLNDYWLSGAAICSKFPIEEKRNIVISKHGYATKHGYPGLNKEAISVRVALPEVQDVNIIVAHPLATIDALKDHRVGMRNLNQLIRSQEYTRNTILIGDMNEWRLIPGSFRRKVADIMHARTGSLLHPTWRYNAHQFTPLRLNLDYVYWNRQSDFSLKTFKVLSSRVSDHQPLLVTFECPQS